MALELPRSVLITGASSGIGRALALGYAGVGVRLQLGGRDAVRLAEVAQACRAAGATVELAQVNVADRPAMAAWLGQAHRALPLDLVLANAGIDGSAFAVAERTHAIFRANVEGVLNTVEPALVLMQAAGRGQIGIVSSLAGLRGLSSAVAYSASKAAVRAYAEGLRGRHAGEGIRVSAICPGFVASPMTANNRFPMPMLWTAERAAARIKRGLARNQGRIAFPLPLYLAIRALDLLPQALVDRLLRRLPRKG